MPSATRSIRDIVSTQPSAAAILQHFGIDLCAQAELPLADACRALQLSVDQILDKLADAAVQGRGAAAQNPDRLSTGRLIQHIVRVHHRCIRQELPRLAEMAHTLAGKRGERAPALKRVEALAEELRADLFEHIHKEEQILFPFVAQLDQNWMGGDLSAQPRFGSVAQPIRGLMQEHQSAAAILASLHRVTDGFQPPEWACATQVALYGGLRAFEKDLQQHVYLENDVLFPRAIQMESALQARK